MQKLTGSFLTVLLLAAALFSANAVLADTVVENDRIGVEQPAENRLGPVARRVWVGTNLWAWYGYQPLVSGYWPWWHRGVVTGWPTWYTPFGGTYYAYWNYQPRYRSFGAISYSPESGKWGVAWGKASRWAATQSANDFCAAEDCAPAVWVQGGCAAVSVDAERSAVFWGVANSKYAARSQARRSCKRQTQSSCENVAWVCSW